VNSKVVFNADCCVNKLNHEAEFLYFVSALAVIRQLYYQPSAPHALEVIYEL
jgi:hypothetical protein